MDVKVLVHRLHVLQLKLQSVSSSSQTVGESQAIPLTQVNSVFKYAGKTRIMI